MINPELHPKRQLRVEIRRRLAESRPGAGPEICAAVARWLATHPAPRTIATFAAMPGEVDLLPLLERFPGHRWALPRVAGDELVFHEIRDLAQELIATGPFGIREPAAHLPVVSPPDVDLWLCPGLAFDAHGGRLGHGRGYYDRSLARARPEAVRVGVCHPLQRVTDVFGEAHDVPMTLVIDA